MKHLKKFETETAFEAAKANLEQPWVALTEDDKNVHFMEGGEPTPTFEYVDLGLPSGTKWAKCNIGASAPEEYGKYFQWGDTVGYEGDEALAHSTWATAPFNNGATSFDSTYFNAHKSEWLDGDVLKPQYDAVYQATNGKAHMPTDVQIQELIDNTTSKWTRENDVDGRKFTSKTDTSKYIFIPAAGYADNGSLSYQGGSCVVWGSSLDTSSPVFAWILKSDPVRVELDYIRRSIGYSVRGVMDKQS